VVVLSSIRLNCLRIFGRFKLTFGFRTKLPVFLTGFNFILDLKPIFVVEGVEVEVEVEMVVAVLPSVVELKLNDNEDFGVSLVIIGCFLSSRVVVVVVVVVVVDFFSSCFFLF